MWARSSAALRAPAVHDLDLMTQTHMTDLSRHVARAALLLGALTGALSAQRGAPLLKTDLIDLLSSPVIPHQVGDRLVRNDRAREQIDQVGHSAPGDRRPGAPELPRV